MLVDPNTGEIIDSGPGLGQSFASQVTQNAMAGSQVTNSHLYEAAEYMPGALQTTGWNSWRGSNTILRGLKSRRPWRIGSKPMGHGLIKGGLPSTFHPSNFSRMPTYTALHPFDGKPEKGRAGYSPFQFLSRVANDGLGPIKGAKSGVTATVKGAFGDTPGMTPKLRKLIDKGLLDFTEVGQIAGGGEAPDMWSGGMVSRLTASGRLARAGSKSVSTSKARGLASFMKNTDTGLHSVMEARYGANFANGTLTGHDSMHYLLSSQKGRLTQRYSGYLGGARSGFGGIVEQDLEKAGGRKAYIEGAKLATKHLSDAGIEHVSGKLIAKEGGMLVEKGVLNAGEKVGIRALGKLAMEEGGAKIAAKAGLAMGSRVATGAIPVVGQVILALQTAYDIGKMGIALMKGGAEFAKDAYKSFQGSLYKPTMGMGYRDTEVAATSRSRGVMAIQNSRLNMRSVLGSEAAGMHAHFG